MRRFLLSSKVILLILLAVFTVSFFLHNENVSALRLSRADVYKEALDVGMYRCSEGENEVGVPIGVGNNFDSNKIACDQLLNMRGKNRHELGRHIWLTRYNTWQEPYVTKFGFLVNTYRGELAPRRLDYATFIFYLENAMARFPELKVTRCSETKPSSGMYFANKYIRTEGDKQILEWCTVEYKGSEQSNFNNYMSGQKYWTKTVPYVYGLPTNYQNNERYKTTVYDGPEYPRSFHNDNVGVPVPEDFTISDHLEATHTFNGYATLNEIFSDVEQDTFYGGCYLRSNGHCVAWIRVLPEDDYANRDWGVGDNNNGGGGDGDNGSDNNGGNDSENNGGNDGDSGSHHSGTTSCTCPNGKSGEQAKTVVIKGICECGHGESVIGIVNTVSDILAMGVGVVGVIGVTVVGTQYLTAGGSEEKVRKAKRRMLEIVIGIAAYVLVYALMKWLMPFFGG